MEKSAIITELATALASFQKDIKAVGKDGNNPFFHSKYATLENVISTIREPLAKVGLSYSQFPAGVNGLTTILMHESGEWMSATVTMSPKKTGLYTREELARTPGLIQEYDITPQAQGSAITYMRRYALGAILGLATEEDDDGNEASTAPKTKASTKTVSKAKGKGLEVFDKKSVPKEDSKRTILINLFKELGIDPVVVSDKLLISEEVKNMTSLELVPDNFDEIIARLQIKVDEMKK